MSATPLVPVSFPQVTRVLKAPPGMEENVRSLPIYTDGTMCLSFWKMDKAALHQAILEGGVWAWIMSGSTQPPILITAGSPFPTQQEVEAVLNKHSSEGPGSDNAASKEQLKGAIEQQKTVAPEAFPVNPFITGASGELIDVIRALTEPDSAIEKPLSMVADFHRAFGHRIQQVPQLLTDPARMKMRHGLITEEAEELAKGIAEGDIVAVADACYDLLYVTFGFMLENGIPARGFDEVHRSNMTKLGEDGKPILREDGKSLKGPNYEAPRIPEVLQSAGWIVPVVEGENFKF